MTRAEEPPLPGAVLTGGRSRRYGRPKAGVRVGGQRMLDRAVESLAGAGVDPVLVVGGEEEPPGTIRLADDPSGWGPVGGLRAALLRTRDLERPGLLLAGCDLPLLPSELLRVVARAFLEEEGGERIVVPAAAGPLGYEPLAGAYPTALLPMLDRLLVHRDEEGAPSLQQVVEGGGGRILSLSRVREVADPRRAFLNVNRPEDRERAEVWLREGRGSPDLNPLGDPEAS